ncbi:hypothetical protein N9R45_01800 [Flavobacteriaceae bacterium]|nr:hypothetical protein [bacterium]MDA9572868.1 hypothetical protein [Flavobacteriaceae bacterium]MDB4180395.1 hypothetical protein [Flavobacteriaceae bacterium]
MKTRFLTHKFYKTKYLLIPFFAVFTQLNAQEVSSYVDTTSIRIGEQITYKINVKADSLEDIDFPKAKDFAPFELINEFKVDTNYLNKKFIISKKFALTYFDSGAYYIPSQKLTLLNKEVKLDSFKITINPVKIDTTKQGLYDIKPIMKSNTQIDFIFFGYILIFIAVICAVLYFKKQIFSFFSIQKLKVEYLTPYEKAVIELTKIKKLNYLSDVDIKTYYSDLTFALRNFIEEKIIKNALESTTKELIQKLSLLKTSKKLNFSNSTLKNIEDVFSRADLVKFAKYEPDAQSASIDLETLSKELENIKLILPEPSNEELEKNLKIQENLRRKRLKNRNNKIIIYSLLSLLLVYLTASIMYGFTYVNDKLFRKQNLIFLESNEWVNSSYGAPPITITTPEVLNRNTDSFIFGLDEASAKSEFTYNNLKASLNIILTNIKLPENSSSIKLQDVMINSIETIEKMGVKNIITKFEKFQTPNDAEGLMIYGSADFPTDNLTQFRKYKYKMFGFINSQDYKQIFISWEENDNYIVEIVDRIVNSVELVKNKTSL